MWKPVKLGDVCDLVGGGTPSKKNDDYYDGDIPWATVRDMNVEELTVTEHKITELGLKNSSSKVIPANNVIIASRVGLGKVCILRQDTAINQDLRGVIPKRENEIDKGFLFYWFNGIANKIIGAGRGATVQGVTLPFLHSLSFPLLPLAEQQRIVAKLDAAFAEIDGVIGQTEKKIHHAKLLMQRTIDESIKGQGSDMLKVQLDEFCDIKHGFAFDGKSFSVSDDESKPIVLTPGNFAENGTTKFNDKNTKRLQIEYNKKLLFSSDDLVVVMTDLSSKMLLLGKPAFIKQSNILHNQRIGLVKNNEQIIVNDYLYFYFRTTNYLNEIKKTASGTMVRHTAPKRILKNTITAPKSLSEQRAISTKITMSLSKSENLIDIYKTKISNLLSLKSATLVHELQSEAA